MKHQTHSPTLFLLLSCVFLFTACVKVEDDIPEIDSSKYHTDTVVGEQTEASREVEIKEGVFLDSLVEGIYFVSGEQSGFTDANGTFQYEVGATIQFSVGGVIIGECLGQELITPVNLVEGATDASHPTVLNIASFIQTLDTDGNADNGITISLDVSQAIEATQTIVIFDVPPTDFAWDPSVVTVVEAVINITFSTGGHTSLVSAEAALAHLNTTLANISPPNEGSSPSPPSQSEAPPKSEEESTVPIHAAVSIAFTDRDPKEGILEGDITIAKASDESDITHYVLYFGTQSGKLNHSVLTTLEKTGNDLTFSIRKDTPIPSKATHLWVFTKNANGEMSNGVSEVIKEFGAPLNAAVSVAFTDTNLVGRQLGGKVTITKASDESDITHYVLYWGYHVGFNAIIKLGSIVTLPKTSSNLTYSFLSLIPSFLLAQPIC